MESQTVIFIRQKQLLPMIGFSAPTLWRKVQIGEFPKPVKLGKNITAWKMAEVNQWISERT